MRVRDQLGRLIYITTRRPNDLYLIHLEEQQRLRPEGSEVMRLVGDNSELRAATGWAPHFDLHAGLEATSRWFLEPRNLAHYRPDQYTI